MRFSLRCMTLILLMALVLRLVALGTRSLWYDETFAVLFSEKGLNAMLYGTLTQTQGIAADVHPLLYYTTLDGWMGVFGESPILVRLLSVFFGLISLALLFRLTRDLFDVRTALLAALIGAIAPFEIQYSQEARMYALLALLLLGTTWCFLRAWRTNKALWWLVFGVLAGLAMYAQQLAAFYLFAIGLPPLLLRRRDRIVGLVLGIGMALVIYFPWLINLPAQLGKIGDYWIPRPTPVQLLQTLWSFLSVELPVANPAILVVSITSLVLILELLLLRAFDAFRRRSRDSAPLAFALYLAIIPVGLMWLVSQWKPVYLTRALLPSALMFYIALGWLMARSRLPRPLFVFIAVMFGLTVVSTLSIYYTWDTFPRPPFEVADIYIAGQWQAGDRIVHANKITALPMIYYNRSLPQSYLRDAPGSPEDTLASATQQTLGLFADDNINNATKGSSRVWFVIFQEQIAQQGGQSPDQDWLNANYQLAEQVAFNDLQIYRYDLK